MDTRQTDKPVVLCGLSGGVDSACCASILKERGYHVVGLYLSQRPGDQQAATETARALGIELIVCDMSQLLRERVIDPFVEGYLCGKTPIPCVLCNEQVKFKLLLEQADKIGAQYIATGHYVRLAEKDGIFELYAGGANDQSYMLYRLSQQMLSRCIFPLGAFERKDEVRAYARAHEIREAEKPDSMEICFIPQGDYAAFIEQMRPDAPKRGLFCLEDGTVLGKSLGTHHYTVGQRRKLGISAENRLFVTAIDAAEGKVYLSLKKPEKRTIEAEQVFFTAPEYAERRSFPAFVRIRHSKTRYKATVLNCAPLAKIAFEQPATAPAPGQSSVFYDENGRVLGGGFIK